MSIDKNDLDDTVDPLHVDRFIKAVAGSLENMPLFDRRDWLQTFLAGVQIRIQRRMAKQRFEENMTR